VLPAAGCLLLVYRFARVEWGIWEALWICLSLVTSIEFFVLSRAVIFDMSLTPFITWALISIYAAQQRSHSKSRDLYWLSMYVALSTATLVKGLLGISGKGGCYGQLLPGRTRIRPDTRIFSPRAVPRLSVSIGHYWYLFKRLTPV